MNELQTILLVEFNRNYRTPAQTSVNKFMLAATSCLDVHLLAPAVIGHELTRRRARLNAAWDETHRQLLRYDKALAELVNALLLRNIINPTDNIRKNLDNIGCQVKDALLVFELNGDTSKLVALHEYWYSAGDGSIRAVYESVYIQWMEVTE